MTGSEGIPRHVVDHNDCRARSESIRTPLSDTGICRRLCAIALIFLYNPPTNPGARATITALRRVRYTGLPVARKGNAPHKRVSREQKVAGQPHESLHRLPCKQTREQRERDRDDRTPVGLQRKREEHCNPHGDECYQRHRTATVNLLSCLKSTVRCTLFVRGSSVVSCHWC